DLMRSFGTGLIRDLFVALVFSLPLLTWFTIVPTRWLGATWHRVLLFGVLTVFWGVQVFVACAEYFFFDEFRSRFNTVAVDYLLYPHEVFINIWDTYPVGWVIAGCLLAGIVWAALAARKFRAAWYIPPPGAVRVVALLAAVGLTALLSRAVSL